MELNWLCRILICGIAMALCYVAQTRRFANYFRQDENRRSALGNYCILFIY